MTVATTNRKTAPIQGNGVNTLFDWNFKVNKADNINLLRYNSSTGTSYVVSTDDYDVALASDLLSGTVTYPNAGSSETVVAATETITIYREVDETQDVDIEKQQAYNSTVTELAYDRLTMRDQELQETLDRCYKVGINFNDPSEIEVGLVNPMTTEGDIIIADINGEPARLGVGLPGNMLISNDLGNPAWATSNILVQEIDHPVGGSGLSIDLSLGVDIILNLSDSVVIDFDSFTIPVDVRLTTVNVTGGLKTLQFNPNAKWSYGSASHPSLSVGAVDVYHLWNDTNVSQGFKINHVGTDYDAV